MVLAGQSTRIPKFCGGRMRIHLTKSDPDEREYTYIQLVHETFRTFVLSADGCPRDLHINEADVYNRSLRLCLHVFAPKSGFREMVHHTAHQLGDYLKKVRLLGVSVDSLSALRVSSSQAHAKN